MMNLIAKTACALTVLTASSIALAVDSVELKVIGTITPAACDLNIAGNGTVDYGNISSTDLVPATYYDLGIQSADLTVVCDAPVRFAIKAMNGRLESVVSDSQEGNNGFAPAPIDLFGTASVPAAGLGLDDKIKIGGFAARLSAVEVDSSAADVIASLDGGTNWAASATAHVTANDQILSWATPSTIVPIAASSVTATLEVNAYLNKPEELNLSKETGLDGLATIEIVYL